MKEEKGGREGGERKGEMKEEKGGREGGERRRKEGRDEGGEADQQKPSSHATSCPKDTEQLPLGRPKEVLH